jgi:hypothetical protein
MKYAVAGAVVTAAVSTIGDYLWANVIPHRVVVYWFAHAIVLFATTAPVWACPSRKPILGAAGCIVIGCSATLSYWFLQPLLGYAGAMFFLFCGMWLAIGVLTGRILEPRDSMQIRRDPQRNRRARVGRRLLRNFRDLDAVRSARVGLSPSLPQLDRRLPPSIRCLALHETANRTLNAKFAKFAKNNKYTLRP